MEPPSLPEELRNLLLWLTLECLKNRADYGGGVRVYVRSTSNITNCNFDKNRVKLAGGAIILWLPMKAAVNRFKQVP